ncbi:hypothetical protein QE152_g34202 [Popillia japonica]|uniref:Uncharacterized protein n=1 Tax=Popillia japonica TaxID=7064 RepID=A0AAW1IU89_POPJA
MGGIDLLDANIALRIFFHLPDMTLANEWGLYRRICKSKHNTKMEKNMYFQLRIEVAKCLCLVAQGTNVKRGRPSSSTVQDMIAIKKAKGPMQHVPLRVCV